MSYEVRLSETAAAMLLDIPDPALRRQVAERAGRLSNAPEEQGTNLKGALSGYRKCRAARRRYRIVYRIDETDAAVIVVAIGPRDPGGMTDVYRLATRLLRDGLLE